MLRVAFPLLAFALAIEVNSRGGGAKEDLEALLKDDPFQIHGLADYKITEFKAGKLIPALTEFA